MHFLLLCHRHAVPKVPEQFQLSRFLQMAYPYPETDFCILISTTRPPVFSLPVRKGVLQERWGETLCQENDDHYPSERTRKNGFLRLDTRKKFFLL